MKTPRCSLLTVVLIASTAAVLAQEPSPGAPRPPLPPASPTQPGPRELRGDRDHPESERPDQPPGRPWREERPGQANRLPGEERSVNVPGKPMPFLGVVTVPAGPVLAAQLNLPSGFGLTVEEVLPNSPAANAGLQKNDVLKLFNDQQLVDPSQFGTLVRAAGTGTDATLTIIRKGQEQKIAVKIGERLTREWRPMPVPPHRWNMVNPIQAQEQLRERVRELHDRIEETRPDAPRPFQELPRLNPLGPLGEDRPVPGDVLREVRPGGAHEVITRNDAGRTTWNTGHARASVKDQTGEVELRSENGHRTVVAKNAAGETTFNGPADTTEQRARIPAEVREKLERLQAESVAHSKAAPGEAAQKPILKSDSETVREDKFQ